MSCKKEYLILQMDEKCQHDKINVHLGTRFKQLDSKDYHNTLNVR